MARRTPGMCVAHRATKGKFDEGHEVAGLDLSHLFREMLVVGRACRPLYALSCASVELGLALLRPEADHL